jgi:hypothetical protein
MNTGKQTAGIGQSGCSMQTDRTRPKDCQDHGSRQIGQAKIRSTVKIKTKVGSDKSDHDLDLDEEEREKTEEE